MTPLFKVDTHVFGRDLLLSLALTTAALLLRTWPFQGLGYTIPYLTFYPVVMFAALLRGLCAGSATTILSALAIVYWQRDNLGFLRDLPSLASLGVFVVNGLAVSAISESMIRTRVTTGLSRERRVLAGEKMQNLRQLTDSEIRYRALFEHAPFAIFTLSRGNSCIQSVNAQAQELFGHTAMQLQRMALSDLAHPEERPTLDAHLRQLEAGDVEQVLVDMRFLRPDESEVWVQLTLSAVPSTAAEVDGILACLIDMTAVRQLDARASENRARLQAALTCMADAVVITDANGRLVQWNQAFTRFMRFKRHDDVPDSTPAFRELFDALDENGESIPPDQWAVPRALRGETASQVELTMRRRNDGETWTGEYNFAPLRDSRDVIIGAVVTAHDITTRRQMLDTLQEQRRVLQEMSSLAHVGAWGFDPVTGRGHWTEEVARIHEVDYTPAFTAEYGLSFFRGEHRAALESAMRDAITHGTPYDLDLELTTALGNRKWVRTQCRPLIQKGKVIRVRGTVQDITDNKRAQEALIAREARLQAILDTTSEGFVLLDDDMRITDVNAAYLAMTGFTRDEILGKKVFELDADKSKGEIKRHHDQIVDRGGDRFETRHHRYDGSSLPVEVHVNQLPQIAGVDGFAFITDISRRKANEARLAEYVRILETSMEGTLGAIANMVEQRDPYTAGHERRVGLIAADLGRELGWNERRCHEMYLVGLVHDLGKISVPAEILSKPGRLSAIEYKIVQQHAERGYEILKDVAFPLPIADIIRQHHERLDGSGYPAGLKDDAILPEARVLAVADVLESMTSHRPYRAALGMEAALQEVRDQRGHLYDPVVVDALVSLVQEKHYKLPA